MYSTINKLIEKSNLNSQESKPVFYRLNNSKDEEDFVSLLNTNKNLQVHDEIQGQVEELVKSINPKTVYKKEKLTEAANKHFGSTPREKYGVWVYYPWSNKLVHILDEEEFITVRTNRNQYKITPAEKAILATKTIGIIGLSVGQSIALTVAMERICGELVITDFDLLELSNLNRIRAGVQSLGVPKTVVVAREIAEIDPFLKVTCMHEGLNEENSNNFFLHGGKKMDLCIEVCDGLNIKIFVRQKAKELHIPVVMNSSDRGSTDIERFDLNPELPILHGLVDHLDLTLVKQAKTNEEKVPYLLPMLGLESSSERLKASMLEIEETITTWPQLASGVIMGGGICTDVSRRILLDQFSKSGRYFVDVETLINDDVVDYLSVNKNSAEHSIKNKNTSLKDFEELIKSANKKLLPQQSVSLSKQEVIKLVEHGVMAPSAGNVQPWKWIYKDKRLLLIHDKERGASILNYRDTASLMGLGSAAENIVLIAQQMGYDIELNKFPLGKTSEVYAEFVFYKNASKSNLQIEQKNSTELTDAIPRRITNRTLDKRKPLEADVENYLQSFIKTIPGAELKLFSDEKKIEELKKIIEEIDWIIMTNKGCHAQFMHEMRWNKKEVEETRDGLDVNTFDITPTERAGLMMARNWNVTKHIKKWGLGKEFGKMSRKAIDSCSALGLITMPKIYPDAYFDGGRAIQKVWLAATKKNVSLQPLSLSTFLSERIADNNFTDLEDVKDKIINLYAKLKTICSIKDETTDIFLFRLCYASEPKVKPLRRFIEDVLIYE